MIIKRKNPGKTQSTAREQKKIYFMGKVIDLNILTLPNVQKLLQAEVNRIIGIVKTAIKVTLVGQNTIKFTIYRNYGTEYISRRFNEDGSFRDSEVEENVFGFDDELIMGLGRKDPEVCGDAIGGKAYVSKADLIQRYKYAALKHGILVKSMVVMEYPDRLEVFIKV